MKMNEIKKEEQRKKREKEKNQRIYRIRYSHRSGEALVKCFVRLWVAQSRTVCRRHAELLYFVLVNS